MLRGSRRRRRSQYGNCSQKKKVVTNAVCLDDSAQSTGSCRPANECKTYISIDIHCQNFRMFHSRAIDCRVY